MGFGAVAIMSPGNMGSEVGRFLGLGGYDVLTCLAGRSDFTRKRAAECGFRDARDLDSMVAGADLVLSILDPAKAVPLARKVAAAMVRTGRSPVYADCNATSPQTAAELQDIIEGAGAVFVDVGIIGARPRDGAFPIFAVSGPQAPLLDELDGKGVNIVNVGAGIGQGSAIKICNAAYNKGAFALYAAVMLAAERYGFAEILRDRLPGSQAGTVGKLDEALVRLPSLSGRYIGEMEQVAETFESIGLPGGFHEAAADLFRLLHGTSLAGQRREEIEPGRSSADTLETLVAEIGWKA